jgi:hypothetical protein
MSTSPVLNSDSLPELPKSTVGPQAGQPPAVPDPYDINNPAAVKQVKDRLKKRWDTYNYKRYMLELPWLRNVLFQNDIQWVRIDFEAKQVANLKLPPNFPRAITNQFAKVNGDLMSAIIQGDIPLNPMPAKDDPSSISSAEICERLREVIDNETQVNAVKRDLGFWVTLTGNGFILPYYDYSKEHGTRSVPQFVCSYCSKLTTDPRQPCPCGGAEAAAMPPVPAVDAPPVAPVDGAVAEPVTPDVPPVDAASVAPPPPPPYSPATNPDGTPMMKEFPIGRLCFESLSPFEVYWDNTVRLGTGKQRGFIRPWRYDVQTAKDQWPDFASKITEGMIEPMKASRNFLTAIAYAGSYFSSGMTGGGDSSGNKDGFTKQLTAWEYRELPDSTFPQGVRAIQLGEDIVQLEPLKDTWGAGRLEGIPFLSLVHFHGETSGGAWGKPRANSLVPLQARRNIIESNLQLTAQRTGAPKVLIPQGSVSDSWVGEAGQLLRYKPISFGGTTAAKPEYLEAALGNVQPLVLLLDKIDAKMEDIAGTHFVQGADVPSGITAASALAFLSEKANRAISPLKEQWAEAWRLVYMYAFEIVRVHWEDERILAILGENKEWEFFKFKGADLTGSVDVSIDYEALFPKSTATRRANIMQLAQMGVITPATDPEQQYTCLKAFGETELKASMDRARLQAIREWDAFLKQGKAPVLKALVQDCVIHLMQHKLDAASQEYEMMPPEQQEIWDAHIQATATEVMVASMPMTPDGAPPATAPGQPGGSKVVGSQSGSQSGPASGNAAGAQQPAPIRKGESMADAPAV